MMETLRRKVKDDHLEERELIIPCPILFGGLFELMHTFLTFASHAAEGRNIMTKINDKQSGGLFASFGFSSLPSLS